MNHSTQSSFQSPPFLTIDLPSAFLHPGHLHARGCALATSADKLAAADQHASLQNYLARAAGSYYDSGNDPAFVFLDVLGNIREKAMCGWALGVPPCRRCACIVSAALPQVF